MAYFYRTDTNLFGRRLTDQEMEVVRRPYVELGSHITFKCVQAFTILGSGIGAGVAAYQGERECSGLRSRAFGYGQLGALSGLLVGPVLTAAFVRGKSRDSISDRAYRLRLNKGQVRTDRLSLLGVVVGAGLAKYCGTQLDQGALFGLAGGCILAGVLNTVC